MDKDEAIQKKIYRIYQCPRCIEFTWGAEGVRRGWCSAGIKKTEVIEFKKFTLTNVPLECADWKKGKAKK